MSIQIPNIISTTGLSSVVVWMIFWIDTGMKMKKPVIDAVGILIKGDNSKRRRAWNW